MPFLNVFSFPPNLNFEDTTLDKRPNQPADWQHIYSIKQQLGRIIFSKIFFHLFPLLFYILLHLRWQGSINKCHVLEHTPGQNVLLLVKYIIESCIHFFLHEMTKYYMKTFLRCEQEGKWDREEDHSVLWHSSSVTERQSIPDLSFHCNSTLWLLHYQHCRSQ